MKSIGIQVVDSNDGDNFLDLKIDPKRDASGKIVSGLVIGNTLQQNIAFILMAESGEIKALPELGVGFQGILLSDDFLTYEHRIRSQLPIDGLKIKRLQLFKDRPVILEAEYE